MKKATTELGRLLRRKAKLLISIDLAETAMKKKHFLSPFSIGTAENSIKESKRKLKKINENIISLGGGEFTDNITAIEFVMPTCDEYQKKMLCGIIEKLKETENIAV